MRRVSKIPSGAFFKPSNRPLGEDIERKREISPEISPLSGFGKRRGSVAATVAALVAA